MGLSLRLGLGLGLLAHIICERENGLVFGGGKCCVGGDGGFRKRMEMKA